MNKFIGIFIFLWLALFYKYIEEVRISKERHAQVQELTSKLFQLEQKNIIDNQIIANNELTKRNLENQSLQMQEKLDRSEERRVGQECRSRRPPEHLNTKHQLVHSKLSTTSRG